MEAWFNHEGDLSLQDLRGRVVALEAFQMLCPGCVSHGTSPGSTHPRDVPKSSVAVIDPHTVFEHHDAMPPRSLEAFLHEYRIVFPVGVDEPTSSGMPVSMARFALRGTPSLLLFDREGQLRAHYFGSVSDMRVGAEIRALLAEPCNGESLVSRRTAAPADDTNPSQRS